MHKNFVDFLFITIINKALYLTIINISFLAYKVEQ